MTVKYDLAEQAKIYEVWAKFYDRVYVKMLAPAHRTTAHAAAACGKHILEVGVGTGLVLRHYPRNVEVCGIDLSQHMLRKALDKVRRENLSHVKLLASMDACRLGFADASFDAVTVPFVITLVPDPEQALSEIARVLKPGGEIVIASRLGAERGVQAKFEDMVAPVVKKIGWSSNFKLSRIMAWAHHHGGFELNGVREGLYFKVVRLRKSTGAATVVAA